MALISKSKKVVILIGSDFKVHSKVKVHHILDAIDSFMATQGSKEFKSSALNLTFLKP